jgi:hypothetical protein
MMVCQPTHPSEPLRVFISYARKDGTRLAHSHLLPDRIVTKPDNRSCCVLSSAMFGRVKSRPDHLRQWDVECRGEDGLNDRRFIV